jgi:hypothetical protein
MNEAVHTTPPLAVGSNDVLAVTAPCVVAYGGGTNSTALLVGMLERGERRMVRRLRCALGLHPYSLRELHATETVKLGRPVMLMAVIERCDCGHSRIAPHGGSMPTKTGLCVPEKYMPGA